MQWGNESRQAQEEKKERWRNQRERESKKGNFNRKLKLEGNPGSAGFFHHWNDLYYRHEFMNSTLG